MANSKIYFTPDHYFPHDKLRTIDFGERLSDLQITPYREVSDSVSMGGKFSRVAMRSGMRVRIVLERFTDFTLAEQFYSLQSHLEAGGVFSFAVDENKKFAAFIETSGFSSGMPSATSSGHDRFVHEARILSEYGTHGLTADDVLHLESYGAAGRREEVRVDAYSKPDIDIKTPALYNHTDRGTTLIRHRDFFPFLVWPQGQMGSPLITHDHRVSWTVDFTCEVYNGNIANAYGQAGEDGSGVANTTGGSGYRSGVEDLFYGEGEGPLVEPSDKSAALATGTKKASSDFF